MAFRLFWFLIGAGTATLWMKHHDHKHQMAITYGTESQKRGRAREYPANQPSVAIAECQRWGWGGHWHRIPADWEEDKAKMMELTRQATDTMGDVSEAALDTLLTTVNALKTRLAEVRSQREQERVEEQRKQQPTKWL